MDMHTIPHGFDSMVYCVPEGTCVGQDDDGNDMIVTDTCAVNDGDKWWVTRKLFDQIKAKTIKRSS